jgi:AAA domain
MEVVTTLDGTIDPAALGVVPIDWSAFWKSETPTEDWVLEPIVAAGRSTAVYSTAKAGKSLLALEGAVGAACGRPIFGQAAASPFDVLYLDLEMTEADLRERLGAQGYGPDDDLDRLHYLQLPSLPPLDTDLGGELLVAMAEQYQARLVVIDTMARAVRGEENSADTYRAFYAATGRRLKAAGVAVLRLDHMGKDASLGQRGSSAKLDDVDVVFQLSVDGKRVTLRRTHSRVPWVPARVVFIRHEGPVLRHELTTDSWPAGTLEAATDLDDLHVPIDASVRMANEALKRAGRGRRTEVVMAAVKFRRTRP